MSTTALTTPQLGMSKVYILDKYFNELQKFWDTEKKRLQGKKYIFLNRSTLSNVAKTFRFLALARESWW